MKHITAARNQPKGWSVGPWNSGVPSAVGYANEGIQECHYHQEMYELYLVAQGSSTALVNDQEIELEAGDILVVEPGEVHTFLASSEGYFHFVIQTPFVPGDKQAMAPR